MQAACSAYHVKALADAARLVASELLDRAFTVAAPLIDYSRMKQFASSVFDPLAAEIAEIAVGKTGRSPQPENADTAARFAAEAWQRLDRKIDLWRLESVMNGGDQSRPSQIMVAKGKKRAGRTKGTGYQNADAPLLGKMLEAIKANNSLNATSAARLFAAEATGNSFEAKVDRLARAYRAANNGE